MRIVHLLLILCATCAVTVNAQSTPRSSGVVMTQGSDPFYAQVELTKDLIELRYCSNDSLEFVLRLNFSNKGKNPVILEKRHRSGAGFFVSRTFENAIKKKYQFTVERLSGFDPADSVPEESNFVVLKSGETYSLEEVVRLYNRRSMGTGPRVLQMVVPNWRYFTSSNIEWRDRWRNRGYLWTDPLTSVPMPFMLAKRAAIAECR